MIQNIIAKIRKYIPIYPPLQSFNACNPLIGLHELSFAEALKIAGKRNVLFDKDGDALMKSKLGDEVGIWVGPEGGFTEEEIGAADAAGFMLTDLGPRTLRAETAAAIGTYVVAQ
jgi:RsmE family RNA methyltransferase